MKLFQVTDRNYRANQKVGPFTETIFIQDKAKPSGFYCIEEFLELNRPQVNVSRLTAVYAFAKIEYCLAFSQAESTDRDRVYEVEMRNPSSSPICLVDMLKDTSLSDPCKLRLRREYWNPTKNWKFMEHMPTSMIVRSEISTTKDVVAGHAAYISYEAPESVWSI